MKIKVKVLKVKDYSQNFSEKGFEFLSNSKVNFYHIITLKSYKNYGNLSIHNHKYETNKSYLYEQNAPNKNPIINFIILILLIFYLLL